MTFKVGDMVITKHGLMHRGEDIGRRLGKVIDNKGHVIIHLLDYHDNPIKCFRYELEEAKLSLKPKDVIDIDIDEFLADFDGMFKP